MKLEQLTALSPLDGRYRGKTDALAPFFSEFALIRYRVRVEVEYLIALAEEEVHPPLSKVLEKKEALRNIYEDFNLEDAKWIKEKEKEINHDVKAVEYYVKSKVDELGLEEIREFVHFGLTSQDINNTANPMMTKEASYKVIIPAYSSVLEQLTNFAEGYMYTPMLARTHGQPASPTFLGKELLVFATRLSDQFELIQAIPYAGKFGGATGNMNAHFAAFPEGKWHEFAQRFMEKLGLHRCYPSTQIEHYDHLAALFQGLSRLNTILLDFCKDIWHYISIEYFGQKLKEGEVGSSAMPHKVNPIDFENAEGNLSIANAYFNFLANKLPVSRLQRDLTDSTVLRNVGVPLGHSLLALKSIEKGLGKLKVNETILANDLNQHWEVLAEGIQTILRARGIEQPYEKLKAFSRTGAKVDKESLLDFINQLDVDEDTKYLLKKLQPNTYTGKA